LAASFLLPRIDPGVDGVHALAGAAMGYLGLRVLFIDGYSVLTGRRGMGLGDAEVLLVVGALLGPAGVLFTLGAGAVQGVIATVIVRLAGGRIGPRYADEVGDEEDDTDRDAAETKTANDVEAVPAASDTDDGIDEEEPPMTGRSKVPFVPFLALAALEYLLGADHVVDAYLRLVRGD
jgi:leader peptidase (prepilin peptidase)/N-methyltransferase